MNKVSGSLTIALVILAGVLVVDQNGILKDQLFWSGLKDYLVVGGIAGAGVASGDPRGYATAAGAAGYFLIRKALR